MGSTGTSDGVGEDRVAPAAASGKRDYGGETAEQRLAARRRRLLAAGVELLGQAPEDGGGLTVRGVCAEAGLTPRYFYESFASAEQLTAAVFEHVIAEAAAAVAAALQAAEADPAARSQATVEAFVAFAVDDPRRARILFVEGAARESLREQRAAALRTFAELAAAQGRELYGSAPDGDTLLETTSYLVVGGVAELLLAWTRGELAASREQLIADTADLLGAVGEAAARIAGSRSRG